jgi:parallel beta-helix repeat protein
MKRILHAEQCVLKCGLFFFLLSLNVFFQNANAQTTVQIGFGGDTSQISGYSPINRGGSTIRYSRANFVMLSSELSGSGIPSGATLTKIAFKKGFQPANSGQFGIWMKNSTVAPPLATTTTWTDITIGHTQVYQNNSQSLPSGDGWVEFTLTTPFVWTGNNLEVATDWWVGSDNAFLGQVRWETDINFATYMVGNLSSTAGSPPTTLNGSATAYKRRPNVQLTFTASACTAPPVAGAANSSETFVCPGVSFTLSLSGNSTGGGQSYQWQRSTDNAIWNNVASATTPSVLINQNASYYYRAIVTCSGQSDTTDNSLFITTQDPLNGSYTINSSSATGGTNFQSLADLAARLNCGGISGAITVTVQPGTYTGRFVLNTIIGASPTNTITINGNGQALTHNATVSAERAAILLNGAKYVTLNGLVINASSGTYGWGIHLMNAADDNRIMNNTILSDAVGAPSTNYAGIVASGSTTTITTAGNNTNNTLITGNTIAGGQHGIILVGDGSAGLLRGNVISNNVIEDMGETGIYLDDNDGTQVLNNDISRPRRSQVNFFRGIYITGTTSQKNLVKNNRIHDPFSGNLAATASAYGIYIGSADAPMGSENIVANNLVYKFNGEGDQYGIWSTGSDGSHIFHNTVVLDDQNSNAGFARGLHQSTAATNVIFRNNISYVTRTGSGNKVALFYSTITSGITSNNNVVYTKTGTGYYVGSWGSSAANLQTTLANFQSASGQDASSVFRNPVFTNVVAGNFKPTNSGADGSQASTTNVGVADDIMGVPRGANPDPGAYEFDFFATDAAVTAFIPPSSIPYCSSTLPGMFTVTNTGTSVLISITINWTVNGVPQTPLTQTGLSIPSGESANITVGSAPVSANVLYSIVGTSSLPNGIADPNAANNSFTASWRTSFTGNYTINKNGAKTASNYQSLKEMAEDLKAIGVCGAVEINVVAGSGPYTEQVIVGVIPGTSSDNTILLKGNGNTLQYDATTSSNPATFSTMVLRGVQYLTVDNFIINTLDASAGYGINIIDGTSNVSISNCTINIPLSITSSTQGAGISTAGATSYLEGTVAVSNNITLFKNTINGGGNGIIMVGYFDPVRRHSNISVIENTLINQESESIQFLGVTNAIVRGNDVSRPGRTSSTTYSGIYFWNATENYVIEKNRIHNIAGTGNATGIQVLGNSTYTSSGTVSNNLIYDFKNNGTSSIQTGIYDNASATATINIYHNTVSLDDAGFTGSGITRALQWGTSSNASVNHNVFNNIFYINRGGTGNKYLVDVSATANGPFLNSNYNVLSFGSSATGTLYMGKIGVPTYIAFNDWQSAGKDANGANANPMFVNPSAGHYMPNNSAIDGVILATAQVGGITTDILNLNRSTNPDPGAYEFAAGILPVKLLSFKGEHKNGITQLQWITSTEINSAGFEIERSKDGVNFTTIGFVNSKASNGNSTQPLVYNFNDIVTGTGSNFYRLKLVDKDTRFEYSAIVKIVINKEGLITISPVYPNPVKDKITFKVAVASAQEVLFTITNPKGQLLQQERRNLANGETTITLPVTGLAAGSYFLQAINISSGLKHVQKIVIE